MATPVAIVYCDRNKETSLGSISITVIKAAARVANSSFLFIRLNDLVGVT
jgi:hypothetical protein